MQTQKFLYNFRKQFSCNFEPQATKRTKMGRSSTSKLEKNSCLGKRHPDGMPSGIKKL